jgi:chromosome partitioning protein
MTLYAERKPSRHQPFAIIETRGSGKQTLYEVERRQFTLATYDRAMECLDAVNGEIEALINAAWGR